MTEKMEGQEGAVKTIYSWYIIYWNGFGKNSRMSLSKMSC